MSSNNSRFVLKNSLFISPHEDKLMSEKINPNDLPLKTITFTSDLFDRVTDPIQRFIYTFILCSTTKCWQKEDDDDLIMLKFSTRSELDPAYVFRLGRNRISHEYYNVDRFLLVLHAVLNQKIDKLYAYFDPYLEEQDSLVERAHSFIQRLDNMLTDNPEPIVNNSIKTDQIMFDMQKSQSFYFLLNKITFAQVVEELRTIDMKQLILNNTCSGYFSSLFATASLTPKTFRIILVDYVNSVSLKRSQCLLTLLGRVLYTKLKNIAQPNNTTIPSFNRLYTLLADTVYILKTVYQFIEYTSDDQFKFDIVQSNDELGNFLAQVFSTKTQYEIKSWLVFPNPPSLKGILKQPTSLSSKKEVVTTTLPKSIIKKEIKVEPKEVSFMYNAN